MRFLFFLCIFFLVCCNFYCTNNDGMESKFKTVTHDTTQFYPLQNYLLTQLKKVDDSAAKMYKSSMQNHSDSALITKAVFDSLAKEFVAYDIADTLIKQFYSQNIFQDRTTNSITFTYTASADSLPLQSAEILLDSVSNVKRVFITIIKQFNDSTVTEKLGWKNDESLFINRITQQKDKKETITQTNVFWKKK